MADGQQGVWVLVVIDFLPGKESAYLRLELQQIEEVSGNGLAPNSFERVLISNGEIHWLGYRHFLREVASVAQIAKVQIGAGQPLAIWGQCFESHPAFALGGAWP